MRFVAHGMHTACVNPAIVKVEESADGDRVVNGFVRIAFLVKSFNVRGLNRHRIGVYLVDKPEESLLGFAELGGVHVFEYAVDEIPAPQQFRRDRGVRLRSKWALVQVGCVGGDQFADARR